MALSLRVLFPFRELRVYLLLMLVIMVCIIWNTYLYQVPMLIVLLWDLPQLTTFTTGEDSFYETRSLSLDSMMIDNWLIWSSLSHHIHYRRFVIQWNKKFEFIKCDDIWLIDLIFLNSLHSLQDHVHSKKQEVWVCQVWWYMIDWFDLPNLTTFTTGSGSFEETTSLSLSSMMIYDWLTWSS